MGVPARPVPPQQIANWLTTSLFGLMNAAGREIAEVAVPPSGLAELVGLVVDGEINANTGKAVLTEMFESGKPAREIVRDRGLGLVRDEAEIARQVQAALAAHPEQVAQYRAGKSTLERWFVGQVMRAMRGKADPQLVNRLVAEALAGLPPERKA
ncbi:MAG: hypothetical protein HY784_07115 [Chloroflexi bacterium]|nr:hypothetical protein [Chloroflexota bacterium]